MTSALAIRHGAVSALPRTVAITTVDCWTQGVELVTEFAPRFPQPDLTTTVDGYFRIVQRTVELNRNLATAWAQATCSASGAVRDWAEAVAGIITTQSAAVRNVVHQHVDTIDDSSEAGPDPVDGDDLGATSVSVPAGYRHQSQTRRVGNG